jgi:hypothetical protein
MNPGCQTKTGGTSSESGQVDPGVQLVVEMFNEDKVRFEQVVLMFAAANRVIVATLPD